MFRCYVASTLALLFATVFARPAYAFFDPPWITPAMPTAGETVSVHIHGGICDAIFGVQGFPQITRTGNAIDVREYGVHYEPGDELCGEGIGTIAVPIGTFSPGDYQLTVDMLYIDGFGEYRILTIGVVPFTVMAPQAVAAPVPTINPIALLVLIFVLAVTASVTMRGIHQRT